MLASTFDTTREYARCLSRHRLCPNQGCSSLARVPRCSLAFPRFLSHEGESYRNTSERLKWFPEDTTKMEERQLSGRRPLDRYRVGIVAYLGVWMLFPVVDKACKVYVTLRWSMRSEFRGAFEAALIVLCLGPLLPLLMRPGLIVGITGVIFFAFGFQFIALFGIAVYRLFNIKTTTASLWEEALTDDEAELITALKALDALTSSFPVSCLQVYMTAYVTFHEGVRPDWWLVVGSLVGLAATATALSESFLRDFPCLGTVYFGGMLAARLTAVTALFLETAHHGWILVFAILATRFVAHMVYLCTKDFALEYDGNVLWMLCAAVGASSFLAAVPMGKDPVSLDAMLDTVVPGDAAPTFKERLEDKFARLNILLTVLENLIVYFVTIAVDNVKEGAQVSGFFLMAFGVTPMTMAIVAYFAMFLMRRRAADVTASVRVGYLYREVVNWLTCKKLDCPDAELKPTRFRRPKPQHQISEEMLAELASPVSSDEARSPYVEEFKEPC